jgi:hypothetical protein
VELTAAFPSPGTVYGSDPCGLAMQMVIDEGQPMALAVIGLVLWLFWLPLVVIVTLVQRRSVGRAVLFALLLGPFALYVVPRLPPGKPANPGWYPY